MFSETISNTGQVSGTCRHCGYVMTQSMDEETADRSLQERYRLRPKIADNTTDKKEKEIVPPRFNPSLSSSAKFQCERFDISNLPAKKAGKSIYWVSEDNKICIQREGYAESIKAYITLSDLIDIHTHPLEILNVKKTIRYHISGFLNDVDISTLSGEAVKELEELKEENPEPEKQKPKLEFFHEDIGFDYMAVQPKQVGKVQVYSNKGKVVIKVAREIVLTTQDMIEKLLQYDEKDLTASIRGISSEKQNILRVYLIKLKEGNKQ